MTVNIALLVAMGVLYACGVYMVLERNLTRILLGIVLMTTRRFCCCWSPAARPARRPCTSPVVRGRSTTTRSRRPSCSPRS